MLALLTRDEGHFGDCPEDSPDETAYWLSFLLHHCAPHSLKT
jgi:hypothetical protein